MDTTYQQYWDSLRKKKQSFWGMGDEITKKIPIIYPSEPAPLIDSIPVEIRRVNEIVEDANYFIFNGKKKVRKIPFLSQLLLKSQMPKEENTSGQLFLTIDPEWILRCSNRQYTSWESCFAPGGCYHFSAKEYTTSINIAMAMITNSDMTKIIGRKFVFIPSDSYDGARKAIVFFAKHYGTFPIHYQRSLSAYIAESIFGSDKDNWRIMSKEDDCRAEEAEIYVVDVDNAGNANFKSGGGKAIWFDQSLFVLREKGTEIENAIISFDSEEEEDSNSNEVECAHCGDYYEEDEFRCVYYNNNRSYNLLCPVCVDDLAVMDEITGDYIYSDEAVEYWHVDYRGNASYTAYTTEGYASRNLNEIYLVSGIRNDNKLCKYGSVYADDIPDSCVKYDGEYVCVDIEDTDNSAILELIKELEGEDDEDKEESEEIAAEALEKQRTTDS
ncbi:MAG: hypothetical protein RBT04_08305 [Sphaerochaetaceae bacterium]|jgi:hypothetical protein|nr:hypothetical protein [Sphaerochaetaceae bacterium]